MKEIQLILSIAIGQGLILAFFLLTSKYYKTEANSWLSFALILLSTIVIIDLLGGIYPSNSILLEFFLNDIELGFLVYVPLFYFFKLSTSSSKNESYFKFYLLIPFLLDTVTNIGIVSYFPPEKIAVHSGVQLFYEIESILSIFFNVLLCYKSFRLIKTFRNDSDKKRWIYRIWQSTLVLISVWIILTLGSFLMNSTLAIFVETFYALISVWMFWLIYEGIVNLKLIDNRKDISLKMNARTIQETRVFIEDEKIIDSKKNSNNTYNATNRKLNSELSNSHFNVINEIMVSEALYRNSDLSIDDVAQRIDMSSGYVSRHIKEATHKNFTLWVNEYRVAEVKVMFRDKEFDNYTTLSIGLEAGFKSKSAFYATFKKITGETPSYFRKKKS
ncbi:Helix-turn-helix domain-containing protein [Marivirga sericea]|uniref:Helix-turn-helix domain-containing protein n=1 Tax=Marivirga sericea TaxID=1028 RepID=A0A1X7L6B6_9BACT|nr:AraC family transcriptional regulator [Marivirga sericea]SMG49275.1 Helix-turn-helix domain-containing protein [Marivirga sericea]